MLISDGVGKSRLVALIFTQMAVTVSHSSHADWPVSSIWH